MLERRPGRAGAMAASASAVAAQGLLALLFLLAMSPHTPPGAEAVRLGVLLNSTEQLDPLVAMNLTTPLNQSQAYQCNSTVQPKGSVSPRNGMWYSVCDEPGINMTSLNITNMTLPYAVNTIPYSISNLFALTKLKMSGIGLKDSLPISLGFMGFMLDLDLSRNSLNGTIPATIFILTNLTSLKFNENRLSGPISTAISQVTSLTHLDLGQNFLEGGVLASLQQLRGLTYLNLSSIPKGANGSAVGIQMPGSTNMTTNMTWGFNDSLAATGSMLGNLTQLRAIDLSNNPAITGNLSDFPWDYWQPANNLQTFNVSGTAIVGPYPTVMFNLTNLTSISVPQTSNGFCPEPFEFPENTTLLCQLCATTCLPKPPPQLEIKVIVGIVIGCAVFVMAILIAAYFILRARRFNDGVEVHGVRRFTLLELQEATDNWQLILGKGGFGEVYKGVVSGEDEQPHEVAVKKTKAERRKNMKKFDSGFRNEILVLSGVRHRNLVELVGYSSKGADVLLVYEFIVQGSMDDLLKKELTEDGEGEAALTWELRLKIAFGAAQGLDYLHSGVTPPIIHRDIKSSNILVDEDFVAKVADFGLSKIRPEMDLDGAKTMGVQGTLGYIDPEYAATLKPTERSDVYSFGVVLLELATGWRPIGGPERKHIIQRVAKSVNSSGFDSVVAPSIRKEIEGGGSFGEGTNGHAQATTTAVIYSGESGDGTGGGAEVTIAAYSPELFQRFVKLGMQCCAKDSTTRPSMRTVAKALGEMIEGKAEDPADALYEERFDEDGGEEVVLLTHNLGGEVGATVAFVMDTQAGPR